METVIDKNRADPKPMEVEEEGLAKSPSKVTFSEEQDTTTNITNNDSVRATSKSISKKNPSIFVINFYSCVELINLEILKAISFKNEVEKSFPEKFADICSVTKCKQNSTKHASILTHYAIS